MARPKHQRPKRSREQAAAPIPPEFPLDPFFDDAADQRRLIEALDAPPPVSIRLNPLKPFNIAAEQIPWCATGRYLEQRPSFTLDPFLHAGAYYVQEASSMLLEHAIMATGCAERDVLALDLCAAPGGKSTHLLSLLSPNSFLVANELDGSRRRILQENLWKWGSFNAMVTGGEAEAFTVPGIGFDLILVDAPCSGEGMFRKDEEARRQWSPRLVGQCARTQARLLRDAWDALSPGGHLVYSTCTWEAMENEMQVADLVALGGECLEFPLDDSWGVARSAKQGTVGYRCYPHRVRGEGYFIAVVRKPGTLVGRGSHRVASTRNELPWLRNDLRLDLIEQNGLMLARPASWSASIDRLAGAVRMAHAGLPVAERKGDAWRPYPAAALSAALNPDAMARIALSREDVLRYLRGEALPALEARGVALACYDNMPLGWLQGAGNRWNSRWPAAWRIRMTSSDRAPVPWAKP